MPNQKNKNKLIELREKVKNAVSMTVVDYKGFAANDIADFRQSIKDQEAETVIARNTLFKLALNEEGIKTDDFDDEFKGENAVVFSYNDPVSYLKTIFEYNKKLELPKVKFALIDGNFTSSADVETISELPSKEQLLAQVVGGLKAPLSGLVNVLGGTQRNFVTVLSRIADKKN